MRSTCDVIVGGEVLADIGDKVLRVGEAFGVMV